MTKSSKKAEFLKLQKKPENSLVKLTDESFISAVIADCLKNDDPKGVIDVIEAYLEARCNIKNTPKPKQLIYYSLKIKLTDLCEDLFTHYNT